MESLTPELTPELTPKSQLPNLKSESKILLSKMSYLTSTNNFSPEVTRGKKPLGELLLSLQERIDIAKVVYQRPNQGINQSYAGQMMAEGSTSIRNTSRSVVPVIPPMSGENQPILVAMRNASSPSGLHSSHGLEAARPVTRGHTAALNAAPAYERGTTSRICARVHFAPSSSSSSEGRRQFA